jgi:hypothetical protein
MKYMNKQKLLLLGLGGFLLVLIFLVLLLRLTQQKPVKPATPETEEVTATPSAKPAAALELVSVLPANEASGVELEPVVEFTFNRSVSQGEVIIEFLDSNLSQVPFSYQISGKKVSLELSKPLVQSMVYTLRVRNKNLHTLGQSLFLTKTVDPQPDTGPPPAEITKVVQQNRLEHPDIFLANQLPVERSDFSMRERVADGGYLHFVVTSSTLSGESLKNKVEAWLTELGLTSEQINSLTIEYSQ